MAFKISQSKWLIVLKLGSWHHRIKNLGDWIPLWDRSLAVATVVKTLYDYIIISESCQLGLISFKCLSTDQWYESIMRQLLWVQLAYITHKTPLFFLLQFPYKLSAHNISGCMSNGAATIHTRLLITRVIKVKWKVKFNFPIALSTVHVLGSYLRFWGLCWRCS